MADINHIVELLMKAEPSLGQLKPHLDLSQKSRAWDDNKITAHHGIIPTKKLADLSKFLTR